MDTHRSITISRWIYARLLSLYPAGHCAEYGADMLQLFTDQCRDAMREKKPLALLALWLRTLADLGVSALREHMTAPHTWQGLLEAVPGAPLPWSGVALVLLPGLVFFVAQVAQLTGQDWFFLLTYRAGYFMIIPVFIVWAWKRKFPIWGLMPLGLLFHTGIDYALRLQMLYLEDSNPFHAWWLNLLKPGLAAELRVAVCVVMVLSILALLWLANRRQRLSTATWAGLGAFLLLIASLAYGSFSSYWSMLQSMPKESLDQSIALGYIHINQDIFDWIYTILFGYLGLLILILLGVLLARRHGRLAILLPLGYLLPTLIYGRVSNDWPGAGDPNFTFMLSVSAAALAYRFLVAVAGPLWIVRSARNDQQKRASQVSLLTLVGIQAAFNLMMLATGFYGSYGPAVMRIAWEVIARQLVLVAAAFLALNLYHASPPIDVLPLRQREETLID
jgi:hypothetical protein